MSVQEIRDFDSSLPLLRQNSVQPINERADRVDTCREVMFSSNSAKNACLLFTGAIVGTLISAIIVEKNPSQRDYRFGLIIFAVANFVIATSLAAYSVCVYFRQKNVDPS